MDRDDRLSGENPLLAATAPFVLTQWYVIAFSGEVAAAPLARRVCGEPIVLFRDAEGTVAALEDRCSHRRYPLSRGRVVGGRLQCGYHGACFDRDGRCVAIPGQDTVPPGFHIRGFPVRERDGVVFVWPGDPGRADSAPLPDWRINAAADWATVRGLHHFSANYQLVLDNLLDLTHVEFVHKNLGGAGVAANPLEFAVEDDVVRTFRMMRDVELPGIFQALGKNGRFDRWQKQIVRAPSYVYFEAGAEPAGANHAPRAPNHVVIQGITPETASSTHYFWAASRHFAIDDPAISDRMRAITVDAFDEDAAVLAAQQESLAADRPGRPLGAFVCDAAGMAVRRIVARQIAAEKKI